MSRASGEAIAIAGEIIPEPTALMLLGLGAVMVRRKPNMYADISFEDMQNRVTGLYEK